MDRPKAVCKVLLGYIVRVKQGDGVTDSEKWDKKEEAMWNNLIKKLNLDVITYLVTYYSLLTTSTTK